jgi:hypothetical protein
LHFNNFIKAFFEKLNFHKCWKEIVTMFVFFVPSSRFSHIFSFLSLSFICFPGFFFSFFLPSFCSTS